MTVALGRKFGASLARTVFWCTAAGFWCIDRDALTPGNTCIKAQGL